jgi:hypothetical protein
MQLRDWRDARKPKWTLETTARALTDILGDAMQARTLHRYEIGQTQIPTVAAEAVLRLTEGQVTPQDFHEARLLHLNKRGQLPGPFQQGLPPLLARWL